jgi:diguanylate cyclase (GGDEF)-like protein
MLKPAIILILAGIPLLAIDSGIAIFLSGGLVAAGLTVLLNAALPMKRRRRGTTTRLSTQRAKENSLPEAAEIAVTEEANAVQATALSSDYRKKQWRRTETVIDEMLDNFIALIGAKLPYHTIAVFFPAQNDSYFLRRYASKTGFVDNNALIVPRRGILGSLLTEKPRPFYEPNFSNRNATLYYYDDRHDFKAEEMVRSIALCPIEAAGDVRGLLLADHTEGNAYSAAEQTFLADTAKLLGQAVYYTYLNTEHSLEYQRLVAMSNTEKDFWKDLEFEAVMNKMQDIIPYAISCDRLTISLKEEGKPCANIVRAYGQDADKFHKLRFNLGESNPKAIVSMAYSKEFGFFRNFNDERYEARYTEDETQDSFFASFMAVPFGVDESRGLMLIESTKRDAFTNSNLDLLSRIGTSAGLALEKIFIIRKANALATHDGLTGLNNNRQFHKILATKISACGRYKEPLSLVMCDIDFFKKLNDTYGHPFGDKVLKGIAEKLESSIRVDIDAAARYGGEEFALILDKTSCEKARETVERIRQSIEDMSFKTANGEEVRKTMSFGIASFPEHARELKDLINHADKALYAAKNGGRNRVVVY